MGLFSTLPFFGRKKENTVVDYISKLLDISYKSVEALEQFFIAMENRDRDTMEDARAEIIKLENDADSYVRAIEEQLYSGAFLPISRSRIIDFVDNVDDLVDASKDAVNISQSLAGRKYDERIVRYLVKLAKAGKEATDLLKKAFLSLVKGSDETRHIIEQIRSREVEADKYKGELYDLLYSLEDPILLFMVSGIGNAVAEISDAAENASDILSLMLITGIA